MKKYGWEWVSEEAAEAYKLILLQIGSCRGSFGANEQLIGLADEVVRLEGRIPDSFEIAVDLGSIYSAAAVSSARDVETTDAFIASANEAWRIASSHFESGTPNDAALAEPGSLQADYIGAYWQIPCEVGFARYIQTDCTDVTQLRALREFWERAKQARPNHPVLQAVGEQIDKKLSAEEQIEQEHEPAIPLSPGIEAARSSEQPRQGRRAMMLGVVVALTIALSTELAYVYRESDSPEVSPQRHASEADPRASGLSQKSTRALSSERQAIRSGNLDSADAKTDLAAGRRAGAMPNPQEGVRGSSPDGNLSRQLEEHIRRRAKVFLAPSRSVPASARTVYSLMLTSSGKIEELTLRKSSGSAEFDRSAHEALLAAQPYLRAGELLGKGSRRTVIVAINAKPFPTQPRKAQRGVPDTATSELSEQRVDKIRDGNDSSGEASEERSQLVSSSAASPPSAASPRESGKCTPGFAGIICRERERWQRCSERWGTPGCEVSHQEGAVTD